MGGIVAMFSSGGPVQAERLERATRSLGHRGPDDRRSWIDAAGSVGLGHTRLAVVDPAGGHQPITSEDESIRAVIDGELYDAERLRGELIARGHRFRTRCDSELVVHLYEEHGTCCVERLRGEFAFALYDGRRDVLLAARDRLGVRPLTYTRHGGAWLLASEAKALFAAGVPAAWDVEAFAQLCALGSPLEDRTMFARVCQLPAGHIFIASRHHHRLVRYWDLDYPAGGHRAARSDAEDHVALAAALDEAVRLRMRGDAPVGCYLSGGIDSCTVLGLAQRHAAAPIRGFTLAFDGAEHDENALAHDMARHCGAAYTPVAIHRNELVRDFEDAVFHAERPLNNINSAALFQLSRAVRDAGVKVVLTGEGSDEIFAGYPHFRRDLAMTAPCDAPREGHGAAPRAGVARRAVARPGLSLASVRAALGGFAPSWLQASAMAGHAMLGVLRPELATRLITGDPLADLVDGVEVARQLRGRHPLHQAMYLWSKSALPGYILSAAGDRIEMAHGVEARLPYLDHPLVELSARLPIDRLIRGGVEKYLLREVARPLVTDAVYRRLKDHFVAPPPATATAGLGELLHDTLRSPRLAATPFFDPPRVVALLDSLPDRDPPARAALDGALMTVLSTCVMQQRFGIGDAG